MYAKENDITVEVTLEGSPANYSTGKSCGRGGVGTISTRCREVVHSSRWVIQVGGTRRSKPKLCGGGRGGKWGAGGGPTISIVVVE